MNFPALSCFCLLLFISPYTLIGQIDITVISPNELGLRTLNIWNAVITNNNNNAGKAYLYGLITERKTGRILEIRSADFLLNRGVTQINTSNYAFLKPEKILYSDKKYEDHAFRTNNLPNGQYKICIAVIDAQNNTKWTENCVDYSVNTVTPPALIAPSDQDKICEPNPFFIWTPFRGALESSDLSYTLKVYEVLTHQKPNTAVKTNPCWYCESNISTPLFQLPFYTLPFKDKTNYAWYVSVYEGKKEVNKSEVWSFYWENCMPAPAGEDSTEIEKKPENPNLPKPGLKYFYLNEFKNDEIVKAENGLLHFKLYNPHETSSIQYTCYDNLNKIIAQNVLGLSKGINYYSVDLSQQALNSAEVYRLDILHTTGTMQYLKFRIIPLSK